MTKREWQAWAHVRNRALECMTYYDDYPGVQDLLHKDLKIIHDLLPKEEVKEAELNDYRIYK